MLRFRWHAALAAACAAGAALAVAGCGSRVGTAGDGQPPKLHIGSAVSGVSAASGASAAAVGEAAPVAPMPGRLGLFGGYVLAGPLPTTPTHAPVWRWADSSASRSDVARLGALLGLTGTPQRHAYGWLLASSGGELRVRDGGSLPWSFVRSDLEACAPYGVDIDNRDGGGVGCAMASAVAEPNSTPPVSDAAARALLTRLGVSGVEHSETNLGDATVSVAPTVGSLPTQGIETRVDVDGRGVRSATGHLGVAKVGADYPLLGAKAAFDELGNAPRPMIAQYCGSVPSPVGGPEVAASPALAPPPVAAPASPGVAVAPAPGVAVAASPGVAVPPSGLPVPAPCPSPEPIRITGATLGILAMWDGGTGGPNVLVPAWFFSTADSTYPLPVVAVDPSFIDNGPGDTPGVGGGASGAGGGPVPVPSSTAPVPPAPPAPPAPATK